MPPLARLISLGILTVLIVALGITFYHVLAPFLLPLFLAWVTAILCRPLYLWWVEKTNGRPRLAAGLTTTSLLLVVLLPLVLGTVFAAAQLIELATTTIGDQEWRDKALAIADDPRVLELARRVKPYLVELPLSKVDALEVDAPGVKVPGDPGYRTPSEAEIANDPFLEPAKEIDGELALDVEAEELQARIVASIKASLRYVGGRTIGVVSEVPGVALGLLGRIISLLVALVIFAIGLYYFLCDGPELLAAAENLIPVQSSYQRELLERFDQVVRAVVLSTFLSALAQGILTTFALWLAGFEHLMVFFVLSSLAAMIPLAGTWVIWAPCAAWLAWNEQAYGWASFIVIFGLVIVGTVDNVIRTYVLNSSAKLHPLLAFVSVLGGLQVMGLWGVFIAPVVAACLHALIQIFNTELQAFSNERVATRSLPSEEVLSPPVIPTPAEPNPTRRPVEPVANTAPSNSHQQARRASHPVPAKAGRSKRRKR